MLPQGRALGPRLEIRDLGLVIINGIVVQVFETEVGSFVCGRFDPSSAGLIVWDLQL